MSAATGHRGGRARFVLDLLMIRRVEFRIAELPILAIPALLAAPDRSAFSTFAFWEGAFLFFLLFAFGDMINCLADRDLDAIDKQHLSRAVYNLGVPFVTFQVVASAIAAVAIAAHLSWSLARWELLALVAAGLALGAAYSVEPVRLKRRGLLQLVSLWLVIFVGPMVFAGMLVRPGLAPELLALAASFGALQMGIVLVNTAEDYPEDRAAGIRNTIVALGLRRGIALAFWLTAGGGAVLLASLYAVAARRGAGTAAAAPLALVAGAWLFAALGIRRLERRVARADLDEGVQIVKREAKRVPLWLTLVAWSTCATALWLFLDSK